MYVTCFQENMLRINEAYAVLSDPVQRRHYDLGQRTDSHDERNDNQDKDHNEDDEDDAKDEGDDEFVYPSHAEFTATFDPPPSTPEYFTRDAETTTETPSNPYTTKTTTTTTVTSGSDIQLPLHCCLAYTVF